VNVARLSEFLNVPEVGASGGEADSTLNPTVAPAIDFAGALPPQRAGKRALGAPAWARQGSASPLRALDPPGAPPVLAITGATGFGRTLCRLTLRRQPQRRPSDTRAAVGCTPC
jgi:hypothetical protein